MLSNKRIIFSVDCIEGYKESIEKVLKDKFKDVFYLDGDILPKDRRGVKYRVFRELGRKSSFFEKKVNRLNKEYYNEILERYEGEIDYFLVVAGREFSKNFLDSLKKKNPKIKLILFLWDKFEGTSLNRSAEKFDYIFSFDREDVNEHNFIYQPSFFIDQCLEGEVQYKDRKYEAYYIGALRDKMRYKIIEKLSSKLDVDKKKYFLKLFINKKTKKELPLNYNKNLIIEEKIKYLKNIEILKNSKVVLDLNHGKQMGLTLRVFESLGTKTKIITTNKDIKNYDFYKEKNIVVIDNEHEIEKIDDNFFKSEYIEISKEIINKYSAKGFIESIFKKINGD